MPEVAEMLFDLARADWLFSRGDGSIISPRLQLQLGGKVKFSTHSNERCWALRGGNLCFLDPKGKITTEFTEHGVAEDGGRILRGRFLGSANGATHVLAEIPALARSIIPNPPPRVAVLIRTHLQNEKVADLISILSESACFDAFVCADCTTTDLQFDGVPILRHRADDAKVMRFRTNKPNLLWYCGDYAGFLRIKPLSFTER